MTRAYKALAIVLVATLGLWGCAKGPSPVNAGADRIKSLEAKNAKLEDEARTVNAAREQLRKRVQVLEQQYTQAQQQLDKLGTMSKERDTLKAQLDTRTSERDSTQAQFEQFRKNIRNLLGQAEAAAPNPTNTPVTSAAETPAAGKS
jgi:phage shock protein A